MDASTPWTLLTGLLVVLGATRVSATVVAGGGRAKTDCYAVFEVEGSVTPKGTTLRCRDGDPACDTDGRCDDRCTFHVRVCANASGKGCTSPGLKRPPKVGGAALATLPSLTGAGCGRYVDVPVDLRRKGKRPGAKRITAVTVGLDRKRDADALVLRCLPRGDEPCPTTTSTTTASSTTTTTTEPPPCSSIPPRGSGDTSCCGPERITITGNGGTLKVGGFAPFPFPPGVRTVIETGAPDPSCKHSAVIPPSGFVVPPFCIPALLYTSQVTARGCASGAPFGAGFLWDGHAGAHGGVPETDVSKRADSSDGACDPGSGTCANDDINVLGDIDETRSAGGDPSKVAAQVDIPAHSLTWQDDGPGPGAGMCPGNGVFEQGEVVISEFDFLLSPTTGTATGEFVDKNGNACALPVGSAGFGPPSPQCASRAAGPCSATGVQAEGPCCKEGQSMTLATVGMAFSDGFPLYDLGFINVIPSAVAECCIGSGALDACTVSTDACQQ